MPLYLDFFCFETSSFWLCNEWEIKITTFHFSFSLLYRLPLYFSFAKERVTFSLLLLRSGNWKGENGWENFQSFVFHSDMVLLHDICLIYSSFSSSNFYLDNGRENLSSFFSSYWKCFLCITGVSNSVELYWWPSLDTKGLCKWTSWYPSNFLLIQIQLQ
jgi:hypothetical protein